MKQIITLFGFLLISNFLIAQTIMDWEQNYGSEELKEYLFCLEKTTDSGFILGGVKLAYGNVIVQNSEDYNVVKIDSVGNVEWERDYGGSYFDYLYSIKETTDGGFILGGESSSSDGDVNGNYGNRDFWIVKIDALGNIEWERNYGGSLSEYFREIQETNDGGFIVGGYSNSIDGNFAGTFEEYDYVVMKIDALGSIQWTKRYGGSNLDYLYRIEQTNDGGFILGGESTSDDEDISESNGYFDYWIVKIDPFGTIEWEKSYGGSGRERLYDIEQINSGGFLLAGYSDSDDGDISGQKGEKDYWVVKIDPLGDIVWKRNYGGSNDDVLTCVEETEDGDFLLGGYSASNDGDIVESEEEVNYWVVKIDALGNMEWGQKFAEYPEGCIASIQDLGNNEFLLGGSRNIDSLSGTGRQNHWIVKLKEITNTINVFSFYDENGNGSWDENEQVLYNLPISMNPSNSVTTYNNSSGATAFYIDSGTYTIQYDNTNGFWETNQSHTIEILDSVEMDTVLYFPMQAVTDVFSQWVDLSSSIVRCSQETNIWLNYTNNGTETTSGYISLVSNESSMFVSATPPVDSIAGDTLYWFYEDLYPTHSEQIDIVYEMPGVENIGEIISFEAEMETWEGYGNDKDLLTSELICAYDPNDKLVTPIGVGEENYTLFEDSLFNYTIRFQNTGNDTAFNIIIQDPISDYLDMDTYQFVASSHEVKTKIDKNTRVIEFYFDDIYLPDSNVNELASHGFVKFTMERNKDLAENTDIQNTGYIYFDSNPPIVTNTTNNTMVSILPTSITTLNTTIPFALYPNPNTGKFIVETKEMPIKTLKIYNSIGEIIQEKNINNFKITLDLDVSGGIYFISIETETGTVVEKIIIQ